MAFEIIVQAAITSLISGGGVAGIMWQFIRGRQRNQDRTRQIEMEELRGRISQQEAQSTIMKQIVGQFGELANAINQNTQNDIESEKRQVDANARRDSRLDKIIDLLAETRQAERDTQDALLEVASQQARSDEQHHQTMTALNQTLGGIQTALFETTGAIATIQDTLASSVHTLSEKVDSATGQIATLLIGMEQLTAKNGADKDDHKKIIDGLGLLSKNLGDVSKGIGSLERTIENRIPPPPPTPKPPLKLPQAKTEAEEEPEPEEKSA